MIWTLFRSSRKCSWIIQNIAKPPFMRICREFENWRDLRTLSGKFLRQKSCYPESFRFLWLCVPHWWRCKIISNGTESWAPYWGWSNWSIWRLWSKFEDFLVIDSSRRLKWVKVALKSRFHLYMTQCKINHTFQSQKPSNFKVVLEW